MQNFAHAADATNTALNSAGSAAQENSRYMESLEAKQQALSAEFEDFANRVLSKDVVSGFMGAGTAMLEFANNDVGAAITRVGLLGTGLTGLVGIVGQTVGRIAEVGLQLKNLGVSDTSFLGMLGSGKFALMVGGATLAIAALVEIIRAVNQAAEDKKFENLVNNYEELKQEAEDAAKNLEEVKKKLQDLQQVPEDKRGEQWHEENEELKILLQYYEQLERARKSQTEYAAQKAYAADRETGTTVQKEIYGVTGDEITSRFEDVGQYKSTEEAVRSLAEKTGTVLTKSQIEKLNKLGSDSERAAKSVDYLRENLELLGYRFTTTMQSASEYQSTRGQLMSEFAQAANNSVRLTTAMQEQRDAYIQTNQGEYEYLSGLKTLTAEQQQFVSGYQAVLQVLVNTTDGLNDAASIVEFLGNRFGLTVDEAFSLAVAIGEVDSRAVGVKNTLVTLADGTIAMASACIQADDGTWQLVNGLEQLGISGQQAAGDLSTLEGQALVLANQLLEEAGASDTAQMSLYDLTAQTIIFNDTGIDVSQKITALQNLAIQAGVTQAAIANIGTPGTVKDTGMSVQDAMKKYGMPEAEAKRYVANQQKQEQTELTEYYTRLQSEMVKAMQESRKSTASSYGGGGSSSSKSDQEEVKAQTINTIEELREYLTDEETRLKLIDPDISKSDLKSTLSDIATIYQSYQDYLSNLKQQGFDETSEQYQEAQSEFAQFVETLKALFSEIVSEGTYSVDELVTYIEKNCGDLSGSISSLLDGLKDKVSSTVSSVTGSIHQAFASGDANSAIAAIEDAWAMIREMDASIEEQYDAAVAAAIENASAEKQVAEEVSEEYDRQNQLLQDKIDLEEKLEALERAKQRRMLVYSEGRFQYMQDVDAISSAQADYQETYRGIEQSQISDMLSQLGDKSSELFSDYFNDPNNRNYESISAYPAYLKKMLMSYLKEQGQGSVFENLSDSQLYDIFGEAMKPGEAYGTIAAAAAAAKEAAAEKAERQAELNKYIREENVKYYGVDTDFGEKIKNAQSQAEAAYWTKLRDTKLDMIKDYREAYGDEAASKYFGTDVSKMDTWKSNQDLYKEAWENQTDAWRTKAEEFKQDDAGRVESPNSVLKGKKITADLMAAEYNAVEALDMEKLGDQRLWDKIFTEAITKDEIQYLYNKAQYDITKGNLLNLAREMKNNNTPGYARGTRGASGGLSLVGENGPELRVLNQGDGILPNGITDNLWRWGSMTPSDMLASLAQKAQSWAQTLNISNVTLPNVRDAQSFVSGLRELAQQYVTRRN